MTCDFARRRIRKAQPVLCGLDANPRIGQGHRLLVEGVLKGAHSAGRFARRKSSLLAAAGAGSVLVPTARVVPRQAALTRDALLRLHTVMAKGAAIEVLKPLGESFTHGQAFLASKISMS